MVRAFRLLRGKRSYVEVGSRDKGGVAMAEVAMGPGANIVEIDIEETPRESAILKEVLSPSTRFLSIVGDCLKADTVRQVSAAIGPAGADVIFCDTVHFYGHALAEFDAYFPLVRSGGLMMIHDCYYQGNGTLKGKSQAFSEIDRLVPVYAIYGNEPLHRFLPRDRIDQPYWAGFAIIIKP
jgi:cephalosporin hydroxylase